MAVYVADPALDVRQHEYEMVWVIQPEASEERIADLKSRISQVIQREGGHISAIDVWGKRTLAYPIKKYFEGYYLLYHFEMDPEGTDELERLIRFTEDIIRHLVIRLDE